LASRVAAGLGAILGDEMGLGKTLQAIALIAHRAEAGKGPALVVVPLTLLETWRRQIRRFAPDLRVYRHIGEGRVRRPAAIHDVDVVLTTLETAVNDAPVLSSVGWDVLVVDEAQSIKNPDTERAR